jgi:ABC-2 type transport system ATP-binding protein
MSPGQQQKLALIAALGFGPEVLILDEPAAALDPVARREFLQELLSLGEGQRTVLFSTHITSDLERVASHVAVLKDGQLPYFDELDVLKERVKRLRIRSEQALPAQLKVPGQFRSEVTGSNAVLSVDFADAALIQRLEQQFDAEIEVEDLNLEEIFLEIHHVA